MKLAVLAELMILAVELGCKYLPKVYEVLSLFLQFIWRRLFW